MLSRVFYDHILLSSVATGAIFIHENFGNFFVIQTDLFLVARCDCWHDEASYQGWSQRPATGNRRRLESTDKIRDHDLGVGGQDERSNILGKGIFYFAFATTFSFFKWQKLNISNNYSCEYHAINWFFPSIFMHNNVFFLLNFFSCIE